MRCVGVSSVVVVLFGGLGCSGGSSELAGDVTYFADGPTGEVEQALPFATPCDGNNFANNNVLGPLAMSGPMTAIRWVPSVSQSIAYLEVFTGESVGSNQLAIWSDSGGGAPLAPLGTTQSFTTSKLNGWQGAALTAPVSVTSGSTYWIVWDPPGGAQTSGTLNIADVQQPYWKSSVGTVNGGASWTGPFTNVRWKFRTFCGNCMTVQRGTAGVVSDTYIASLSPLANNGASPTLSTGSPFGASRQSLMAFDTSSVPVGSTVSLGKLRVWASAASNSALTVHDVTTSWGESTVTWSSFAGGYNAVPTATTASGGPSYNGPLQVDVTGLADGWVQGTSPNNGVLLTQTSGSTSYGSSEGATVAKRPALDICWDPPPASSCPLAARPYHGELCGSTAPCVVYADEVVSASPQPRGDVPAVAVDETCTPHVLYNEAWSPLLPEFHAIRTGPGAWSISSTPTYFHAAGAEPLGGTAINTIVSQNSTVSSITWSGSSWSAADPFPQTGVLWNQSVAQGSAGGAVHAAILDPSASFFHYAKYLAGWTSTIINEPSVYPPAIALSPEDHPSFAFLAWSSTSLDLRWLAPSTSTEVVTSGTTDFDLTVTVADAQNLDGKPHIFTNDFPTGVQQINYRTRVGPGTWTTQLVDQVSSSWLCADTLPTFHGETCAYTREELLPMATVSAEKGSVRLFYAYALIDGMLVADCSDICYWTDVATITVGELRMAVIEPFLPLSVVTIPGVSLYPSLSWIPSMSAKLDGKGDIYLAYYDRLTMPGVINNGGDKLVRFLHLGY